MGRPPTIPPEKKTRIVLAILAGEMSIADAARREKVSEQSIGRWKAEFLEAGKTALVAGRSGPSSREEQLEAEVAERTWRRKQAKARTAGFSSGPWPRPARNRSRQVVVDLARRHPAWGHRKIWAMARHDGHQLTMSTVLRILRDEGLLLQISYQRDRRRLAAERKAAFCDPPTRPNQVWQFDFSEYETSSGGTWRTAGVADYWSKYEFGWHWSATANQHDAIAGVELALSRCLCKQ